jgi:hypothetical protein
MLGKIMDGLQSLYFDTLTLSPTMANWVERWSKVWVISLIDPTMWISSARDGKMQLGVRVMVFKRTQ